MKSCNRGHIMDLGDGYSLYLLNESGLAPTPKARSFELPDDHRDPLIGLSLQLVGRAGERRRGEVRVGMSVQPCDPSTDAQTPAKTEREPAASIADKRKHDHAGRYRGDPRDVAVPAGGRRGPVPLRGLRVGRAEGAVLARLVL